MLPLTNGRTRTGLVPVHIVQSNCFPLPQNLSSERRSSNWLQFMENTQQLSSVLIHSSLNPSPVRLGPPLLASHSINCDTYKSNFCADESLTSPRPPLLQLPQLPQLPLVSDRVAVFIAATLLWFNVWLVVPTITSTE